MRRRQSLIDQSHFHFLHPFWGRPRNLAIAKFWLDAGYLDYKQAINLSSEQKQNLSSKEIMDWVKSGHLHFRTALNLTPGQLRILEHPHIKTFIESNFLNMAQALALSGYQIYILENIDIALVREKNLSINEVLNLTVEEINELALSDEELLFFYASQCDDLYDPPNVNYPNIVINERIKAWWVETGLLRADAARSLTRNERANLANPRLKAWWFDRKQLSFIQLKNLIDYQRMILESSTTKLLVGRSFINLEEVMRLYDFDFFKLDWAKLDFLIKFGYMNLSQIRNLNFDECKTLSLTQHLIKAEVLTIKDALNLNRDQIRNLEWIENDENLESRSLLEHRRIPPDERYAYLRRIQRNATSQRRAPLYRLDFILHNEEMVFKDLVKILQSGTDLEFTKYFNSYCIDINFQDDCGNTLAHHAAQYDRLAVLGFLRRKGIKMGTKNAQGKKAEELLNHAPRLPFSTTPQENMPQNINLENKTKIAAFEKIYAALYESQTTFFKRKGFSLNSSLSLEDSLSSIQNYAKDHPTSRTSKAWELAQLHYKHTSAENIALFASIHEYGFSHSSKLFGLFKRSTHFPSARTKKLLKKFRSPPDFRVNIYTKIEIENALCSAKANSRTYKIRRALNS